MLSPQVDLVRSKLMITIWVIVSLFILPSESISWSWIWRWRSIHRCSGDDGDIVRINCGVTSDIDINGVPISYARRCKDKLVNECGMNILWTEERTLGHWVSQTEIDQIIEYIKRKIEAVE